MKIFVLSLVFFSMSSCTHIRYRTKNTIPLGINKYVLHVTPFEVLGEKEFYLWGKFPAEAPVVDIEQEVMRAGFSAASSIYIEEFQSPGSFFLSILTFGLYMPVDYAIRGVGVKPRGN